MAAVGMGLLAWPAALPGASQDWLMPGYEYRAVFQVPTQVRTHALLTLPLPAEVTPQSGFALADAGGSWVPFRLLFSDGERATFLVEIGAHGRSSRYVLYYRAAPDPEIRQTAAADPMPVTATLHRMGGRNVPNTWEKMLYVFDRVRAPVATFFWPEFGGMDLSSCVTNLAELGRAAEESAKGIPGRRTRWKRRAMLSGATSDLWVLRLACNVLCPRDGVYRLALVCDTASFISMDGQVQAGGENRYGEDEWRIGPPVLLKAGTHRLEALTCAESNPTMRVGWIPPPDPGGPDRGVDPAAVVPIPRERLLTAVEATDVARERRDATLRPAFTAMGLPSYAFRGYEARFTPVRFRNVSPGWSEGALSARWLFGDGLPCVQSEAFARDWTDVTHTFPSAAVYTVALELRDPQGFVERAEKTVDCSRGEAPESLADFDVLALPPVRYASDVVQPVLRFSGQGPANAEFTVRWTTRYRSGMSGEGRQTVRLKDTPGFLPLVRLPVSEVAEWNLCVEHMATPLRQSRVRFLTPPFEVLPARVEGDRLYAEDGSQLVLAPARHAGDVAPPAWPRPPPPRLLWVDDALGCPGLPGEAGAEDWPGAVSRALGRTRPAVSHVAIDPWETESGAFAPLLRLATLATGGVERADAVILSVGLQDLLQRRDPEDFERYAAAISDIVSGTLRRPALWVTLPPYPFAGERVREYAVAVRRVADARGLGVADLYTALAGAAEDPAAFFPGCDVALSRRGRQIAVRTIARAVAGGREP
jgi:hypothetical protein